MKRDDGIEYDGAIIIRGDGEDAAALRWLQMALTDKDDTRAALHGVHLADGMAYACDGYRLHAVPLPKCLGEVEKPAVVVVGKVSGKQFMTEAKPIPAATPVRFDDVVNQTRAVPVEAEIVVNPKYLRDALQGMGDMATIRIRPDGFGMEIISTRGRAYALVMPMHTNENPKWVPYEYEKEGPEKT